MIFNFDNWLLIIKESQTKADELLSNATTFLGDSLTTANSKDEVTHYLILAIIVTIVSVSIPTIFLLRLLLSSHAIQLNANSFDDLSSFDSFG